MKYTMKYTGLAPPAGETGIVSFSFSDGCAIIATGWELFRANPLARLARTAWAAAEPWPTVGGAKSSPHPADTLSGRRKHVTGAMERVTWIWP